MARSNESSVTRRTFLGRMAGGLALALTAGAAGLGPARGESGHGPSEAGDRRIRRVARPYDAETRVEDFRSWLTPNDRFFVRSHFGPPSPDKIDKAVWRLALGGLVLRPLSLSFDDLSAFEEVSVTAVLQCSGNGRAFHRPKVPGVQWERGAVGNAKWTGIRLRDLLQRAGPMDPARHLHLQGADRPVAATTPLFLRSIPIDKAMHPDTILAYRMNDAPLPLLHGAPLRLITPGWMGESCMKWLTDLTLAEEEAKGYYMETAYRYPVRPVTPGEPVNPQDLRPVEAMAVKSLITSPGEGAAVPPGPVTIEGVAWTGEGRVTAVEVSLDEGRSWQAARLRGEDRPYAWRPWDFPWRATEPGRQAILCRATDDRGRVQPLAAPWNPGGFLWNGVDRVTVQVTGG